jgi:translation initiation factor 2A
MHKVSKQVYRPPGARGAPSTFKLHDDDENTTSSTATSANTGSKKEENLSKTALKNKKKREAAKKRKEEEGGEAAGGGGEGQPAAAPANSNGYQGAAGLLFDAEKEKKIRKIMDKIKAIDQLKTLQETIAIQIFFLSNNAEFSI